MEKQQTEKQCDSTWFNIHEFDKGMNDAMDECLFVHCTLEAHESMGESYCTGFDYGMRAARAFNEGFDAGTLLNICCCHLADGEDPDFADKWLDGLWACFSTEWGKGFYA